MKRCDTWNELREWVSVGVWKSSPQRDLQGRTTAWTHNALTGSSSPFKMKGKRVQTGLKWRPSFLRHRVEQTELIHGLEQERRQPRCWQVPYRGDIELCSPLTCSVPLGSTQTEHKSFNTLKHALIKNLHSTSVLRHSICLINSSIHHFSVRRTLIFRHSQNTAFYL